MTKPEAWMPLYVGDYLGDTQRLTTEQHGAYLLLILDYWRNGPPPDDDAVLQQIAKLDRASWKRHRNALARLFRIDGGEWRHKRIDQELDLAKQNAERRSSKAKAAAEARWGNSSDKSGAADDDTSGNANGMQQAMLGACSPPSPSPSSLRSESDGGADARAIAAVPVEAFPADLISITSECARIAGVRHVDPGRIIAHQQVVREWIDAGLDPQTDIIPAIRDALQTAPDRVTSLKYFDGPVRQAKARKEAQSNGARARDTGKYSDRMRDPVLDDLARGRDPAMARQVAR